MIKKIFLKQPSSIKQYTKHVNIKKILMSRLGKYYNTLLMHAICIYCFIHVYLPKITLHKIVTKTNVCLLHEAKMIQNMDYFTGTFVAFCTDYKSLQEKFLVFCLLLECLYSEDAVANYC